MSQIRLYLDEDTIRRALIQALRNAGIDVVTTSEANNLSCTDEQQLVWAAAENRVIYSFNMRDFCRLHQTYMEQGIEHSGIIVVERQSYSVGEQLRGVISLVSLISVEERSLSLCKVQSQLASFTSTATISVRDWGIEAWGASDRTHPKMRDNSHNR